MLSSEVPSPRVDLDHGPFTVADARAAGLKWSDLQTRSWRRLCRAQYASTDLPFDVDLRLSAAAQRLPEGYAFSGRTAACLHGLDFPPCEPIEATVPREVPVRARSGVKLRRSALPECDVTTRNGYRVTSAVRTIRDLGSSRDVVESVVALDMAFHAAIADVASVQHWVDRNGGAKGVKRLRRALALANPLAESPMETRLRLELIASRLPPPVVQAELRDRSGTFLGRVDMYYPDVGLILEFDGQNHKDRLVEDLRRQNGLINAGYHVLRFTAPDLRFRGTVAAQVRRARKLLSRKVA